MSAVLSDCGRYRYTLEREWMTGTGTCLFIMLNPSTADAEQDDPTIRRCMGFAQRWGYQRLAVGNLYAYRATDPGKLPAGSDAVGPENDAWLMRLSDEADLTIVAWGAHPTASCRGRAVLALLHSPHHCLATTKHGRPRHPLYVKGDTEPVPFAVPSPEIGAVG